MSTLMEALDRALARRHPDPATVAEQEVAAAFAVIDATNANDEYWYEPPVRVVGQGQTARAARMGKVE